MRGEVDASVALIAVVSLVGRDVCLTCWPPAPTRYDAALHRRRPRRHMAALPAPRPSALLASRWPGDAAGGLAGEARSSPAPPFSSSATRHPAIKPDASPHASRSTPSSSEEPPPCRPPLPLLCSRAAPLPLVSRSPPRMTGEPIAALRPAVARAPPRSVGSRRPPASPLPASHRLPAPTAASSRARARRRPARRGRRRRRGSCATGAGSTRSHRDTRAAAKGGWRHAPT